MKRAVIDEIANPELRFVCKYIEEEIFERGFTNNIIEIDFENICECDKIKKACEILGYKQKIGASYMKRLLSTHRYHLKC
ncbi:MULTISPECIES: hypothetical protein [Anaerosinus]|uniref:Uncharacterized protein n=1 Tax=Selenobaculum gibii TaxID=3054208 RepID=A0A9Y2AGW3_9FIRM|nr:hypothetical protein [Selenobaculum gbiensis]WIW70584.1 hypothetical protein P3F81_11970 [Selenobaculum gbiensis]